MVDAQETPETDEDAKVRDDGREGLEALRGDEEFGGADGDVLDVDDDGCACREGARFLDSGEGEAVQAGEGEGGEGGGGEEGGVAEEEEDSVYS